MCSSDLTILATLTGHSREVTDIAWSQENDLLASVSLDGMVRLWSNPAFECVAVLDLGGELTACAFSPNNPLSMESSLAVATELAEPTWQAESEITVIVLQTEAGDYSHTRVCGSEELGAVVRAACFAPELGELLFVGLSNGKMTAYTHNQGKISKEASLKLASAAVTHLQTVSLRPSTIVMANTLDGSIKLLHADSKGSSLELRELWSFKHVNQHLIVRGSFCPSMARSVPGAFCVVCGDENNSVAIHGMPGKEGNASPRHRGNRIVNQLIGHDAPVLSCGWSGDGSILLTCDAKGSVCLWLREADNE